MYFSLKKKVHTHIYEKYNLIKIFKLHNYNIV